MAILNENDMDKRVGEGKSLLVAKSPEFPQDFSYWSFEDDNPECINDFVYEPYDCYFWNQ